MFVVNRTRRTYLGVDIRLASSFRSRLKGLLAQPEIHFGDGVWLVPCNSIQTFRMRWPIDAVFLDEKDRVIHIVEGIARGRVVWPVIGAHATLEVPAGVVKSSETGVGDQIELIDEVVHLAREASPAPEVSAAHRERASRPASD